MAEKRKIVISLGGSLIVPDEIDTEFLRAFRDLISKEAKNGTQFFVVSGGGKVCRRYQDAARELGISSKDALDWLGIYATRLNAQFIRILFGGTTHKEVVTDPEALTSAQDVIIFGAGGVPGHSSDYAAVELAKRMGAQTLINLSNIDYVYDSDPRKNPDAKKLERISWQEFRKVIPSVESWHPGMSAPFDPVAAKEAEAVGLEVVVMNGKPVENLENYLSGKAFKGTVINQLSS